MLPGPGWLAVAWLTPAIAGVTLCLALSPRFGAAAAATTVGAAWSATVVWPSRRITLTVVNPTTQLVLAALTAAGSVCWSSSTPCSTVWEGSHEPTSRTTITLAGVGKTYGRTTALTGIDLTFGPGITGLLGPNGAGKTTLLRILATALAADAGSIHLLG